MKYVLALSSLLLAVGCDTAAPREEIPAGETLQQALRPPPTIETDETDDPTTTAPACDEPCGSPSDCGEYNACYAATCSNGCCGARKLSGTTVCTNGTCCVPTNGTCSCLPSAIACAAGYANCNGDLSDGCEAATSAVTSCGASCTNCNTAIGHASGVTCTSGACGFTACTAGWGNCDGNDANGCETSTLTSAANCGSCGNACSAPAGAAPICNNGSCDFVCSGGLKRCGDECKTCCEDGDCKMAPTKCHTGKCSDEGTCSYTEKICLVRDCYSPPVCDPADGVCKATPQGEVSCGNNACNAGAGTCSTINPGECVGAVPITCPAAPLCKVGICNQSGGGCEFEFQPDTTPCVPDDKCQAAGVCIAGTCNGLVKTCDDPGQCRSAACNSASGNCDVVPLVKGSPCTLNNPCRQNEECDGDGTCAGSTLPDGTACGGSCPDGQLSQCIAGECGCATAPDMTPVIIVEEGADMSATGGADKKSGCSVGASAPSLDALVATVFFLGLLAGVRWLHRPRARLVKYARRRRF